MSIKIYDSDGDNSIDIDLEELQNCLEEQGYGVLILPENMKFFAFWSSKREILSKGHEIREEFEKTKTKCGYVLHG